MLRIAEFFVCAFLALVCIICAVTFAAVLLGAAAIAATVLAIYILFNTRQ